MCWTGAGKVLGGKSLAKELGESDSSHDLSLTGVIHYGTPLYDSEIARGLSDLDEKSDVFALGILLLKYSPFSHFGGKDITEIKKKLLDEPYRLPREVAPERKPPKTYKRFA